MNEDQHTLYCSFCGKSQKEVFTMIAGPAVFICDECVSLCANIIIDRYNNKDEFEIPEPLTLPENVIIST